MVCQRCGTPLISDQRICTRCGAPQSRSADVEEHADWGRPAGLPVVAAPATETALFNDQAVAVAATGRPEASRRRRTVLVAAGVLFAIVLAWLWWPQPGRPPNPYDLGHVPALPHVPTLLAELPGHHVVAGGEVDDLVLWSRGELSVWDLESGTERWSLPVGVGQSCVALPDGDVACLLRNRVQSYDARTGTPGRMIELSEPVSRLAALPNGDLVGLQQTLGDPAHVRISHFAPDGTLRTSREATLPGSLPREWISILPDAYGIVGSHGTTSWADFDGQVLHLDAGAVWAPGPGVYVSLRQGSSTSSVADGQAVTLWSLPQSGLVVVPVIWDADLGVLPFDTGQGVTVFDLTGQQLTRLTGVELIGSCAGDLIVAQHGGTDETWFGVDAQGERRWQLDLTPGSKDYVACDGDRLLVLDRTDWTLRAFQRGIQVWQSPLAVPQPGSLYFFTTTSIGIAITTWHPVEQRYATLLYGPK